MIRVQRKVTERSKKAIDSLKMEKAKNGSYNTAEVNAALKEMFHGKCYICENSQITSYQIEHLKPHRGNRDLKFDWDNLFLACAHCNNIKQDRFEPIIDCSKENVEELIAFRKRGYFGIDEQLIFDMLDTGDEVQNTVKLLQEALEVLLRQQLGDKFPFAAFKRWLIRDNKEAYPELMMYIE